MASTKFFHQGSISIDTIKFIHLRSIVTGDQLGHIKFFDQTLKLTNWYQDFHLGPVNSISFAYVPDFDET